MKKLRYILQHRYLLKILAIVVLISAIVYTQLAKHKSIYQSETQFVGIVYKQKITDNKQVIYLKTKEKLLIESNHNIAINLGDKIIVSGVLTKPKKNTIPNLFDYQNYLYNNGIYYIVKASSIKKVANNTNIIYYLREKISKRIDVISKENSYLKTFILGDSTSLDSLILSSYQQNGLSHLFSISGMHISLFAALLLYLLKRISYNNYYNYLIVISFLIIYALIIGSSPSVIRSVVMYILFAINKVFNLKIKSINIMCLLLIVLLIINPFYLYHISFQYSYLISFSLLLFNKQIRSIKQNITRLLYISFIAFMVSIPISIYHFYQLNFLSIILNIIYIPLVTSIIFPLSLISFILPIFSYLLNALTRLMEMLSIIISNHNIGIINFSKPSVIGIIIYYIFIYMFLYNKKHIFIFLVILIHKHIFIFDGAYKIVALDVNQGDSIALRMPRSNSVILIDTGGLINSDYEMATNRTLPYLKSQGIKNISHMILTHGDYDHMGEAINLVNNFKVDKVIFNCGPYNELEKELIKVLDKKHIEYYSCIKKINIDKNKLYFLQTKEYDNENDNSNVIFTELNGYKFMFMGDASITKEKEILSKYNLPDIDVLKVGHHGSKTSSGEYFINKINPKYSIISVGKNNRYGHPNKEVLENLKYSKIYRTDQDGSIMFKIKNNKLKVETCSP